MSIDEYVDMEITKDNIERLRKLIVYSPNSTRNLKGLSFSKQLETFDMILSRFGSDPFLGISIMENYDLKDHDLDDEMELLLMELSIRKNVIEDHKDKVYHILGLETWNKKSSG